MTKAAGASVILVTPTGLSRLHNRAWKVTVQELATVMR
jgi:hypothetical protein